LEDRGVISSLQPVRRLDAVKLLTRIRLENPKLWEEIKKFVQERKK
jgi:hypothetical protein